MNNTQMIKQQSLSIIKWNDWRRKNKIILFPHPNSEQAQLNKDATIALDFFDNLATGRNEFQIGDVTIFYRYDGEYEYYDYKS